MVDEQAYVSGVPLMVSAAVDAHKVSVGPALVQIDLQDGGRGRIRATVKQKSDPLDLPLRRRVVLFTNVGKRPIRETWSDPVTGEYEFAHIAMDRSYDVGAYDHTGAKRAILADNLKPEPMP